MIHYYLLPSHIRNSMKTYIEDGRIPGGFLEAVIRDRLIESFVRADDINRSHMFDIANFMYNEVPFGIRGSKEAMENHNLRVINMTDKEKATWIKCVNRAG